MPKMVHAVACLNQSINSLRPVTPYGNTDLGEYWLLTWTNVDFWFSGIHLIYFAARFKDIIKYNGFWNSSFEMIAIYPREQRVNSNQNERGNHLDIQTMLL